METQYLVRSEALTNWISSKSDVFGLENFFTPSLCVRDPEVLGLHFWETPK
jgi:hypothetical protein